MKTTLYLSAFGTLLWVILAGNVGAQQLPDVAGIRLGMPAREAFAALQASHPKVKLDPYSYPQPTIDKPILIGFSLGFAPQSFDERIAVHVTPPPEKQAVWLVQRFVGRQKIFRANVIASLREKYGKESAGITSGMPVSDVDKDANELWWIFDEQGHPGRFPSAYNSAYQCLSMRGRNSIDGVNGQSLWEGPDGKMEESIQDEGWCNTSMIALVASIGGSDIITAFSVQAIDMPLAMRSARAELAWFKDLAKRQQQQEINESKQAKPRL